MMLRLMQRRILRTNKVGIRGFSLSRYSLWKALTIGGGVGGAFLLYNNNGNNLAPLARIRNDVINNKPKLVKVGSSSNPPFPEFVQVNGNEQQLLGVGIRTVSFLKFHVYTLGIYVSKRDLPQLLSLLSQYCGGGGDSVKDNLLDADKSIDIFNNILNSSSIEMSIRICTSRQTDFGHLRDGFVRSVSGNKGDDDDIQPGIAQLRSLFSQSRSLGKNRILTLVRHGNGSIDAWCQDNKKNKHKDESINTPLIVDNSTFKYLGKIDPSPVTNLLFLHYLAGKNPASPSARQSLVDTLVELIK